MRNISSLLVWLAIFVFIGLIALYIFVFRITPEDVPKLIQAWVVTQVEGDPVASNEPRVVSKGQNVKLLAVISGRKKDSEEITYFTNAQELQLDGNKIPSQQIEKWQRKWGTVKIMWSKVEPMLESFTSITHPQDTKVIYRENFCDEWPFIWELDADVNLIKKEAPPDKKDIEKSEFEKFQQDLGTMRYTIIAVIYWGDNRIIPIREASSPGIQFSDELGIKDEVTRLSIKEDNTLIGTMRAIHNLPYINYVEPQKQRIYRIKHLIGFDSIGSIMATLMLMGYKDLGNYDLETLEKLTKELYDDVYLSEDGYYYLTQQPNQKIKFGSSGIRTGDLIISGDHIGVISRDIGHDGLPNGWFDYADTVLHCYNAPLKEEYISETFLSNFTVLRLN